MCSFQYCNKKARRQQHNRRWVIIGLLGFLAIVYSVSIEQRTVSRNVAGKLVFYIDIDVRWYGVRFLSFETSWSQLLIDTKISGMFVRVHGHRYSRWFIVSCLNLYRRNWNIAVKNWPSGDDVIGYAFTPIFGFWFVFTSTLHSRCFAYQNIITQYAKVTY